MHEGTEDTVIIYSFTSKLSACWMPGLELGAEVRAGACLPAYVEQWT